MSLRDRLVCRILGHEWDEVGHQRRVDLDGRSFCRGTFRCARCGAKTQKDSSAGVHGSPANRYAHGFEEHESPAPWSRTRWLDG